MHHPPPLLAARTFALRRREDGRPQAVFRSNLLVPRIVWGLPVPFYLDKDHPDGPSPILVYGRFAVPVREYLRCFEETAHYPDDADHNTIEFFETSTDPTSALTGDPAFKGPAYQARLLTLRNNLLIKTFEKKVKELNNAKAALLQTSQAMGVGQQTIVKVLAAAGYELNVKKTGTVPRSQFSTAFEHLHRNKLLKRIVQSIRSNKPVKSDIAKEPMFHINDLYVDGAPGGYATHCPVTGIELYWDAPDSYHAPRVGLYDISWAPTPSNVVIMSKFAQRLTYGTGDIRSMLPFVREMLDEHPDLLERIDEWSEKYHLTASTRLRAEMLKGSRKRHKPSHETTRNADMNKNINT